MLYEDFQERETINVMNKMLYVMLLLIYHK